MTSGGAFVRLLFPSMVFFLGLVLFRERSFEAALVGAGVCAIALPWLVIMIVRVARLLRVEPPVVRRGFEVMPVTPPLAPPARAAAGEMDGWAERASAG